MFAGAVYDLLSTAGGVARRSVAGPFPGREIPQTNGWTFWEYRSADGTLHPLDGLRHELHERKVVSLVDGRRTGYRLHGASLSARRVAGRDTTHAS